jgi:hypothetical protein
MPVTLSTWEAKTERIADHGQPSQKVGKSPSQPMAGYSRICLSFQLCGKTRIRGSRSGPAGHKARPYEKVNMVETLCTHVLKWKMRPAETIPGMGEGENLTKSQCTPSTTI